MTKLQSRAVAYLRGRQSTAEPAQVGKFTLEQVQERRGCLWGFGRVPSMTLCGKPRDERAAEEIA